MFSQLTNGFFNKIATPSTIIDELRGILSVGFDLLNPQAVLEKEENIAELQQAFQNLENKKKIIENLKSQHKEKWEKLEVLAECSKTKQQELDNATLLVEQKLIEKQTVIESLDILSREIERLAIVKQLQERKAADLTLKIDRRKMEAELKPSKSFQLLLENTKLIGQKNNESRLVRHVVIEPIARKAEIQAVTFAAPKNVKTKKSTAIATAASFREPREKTQTDFYGFSKPKINNNK